MLYSEQKPRFKGQIRNNLYAKDSVNRSQSPSGGQFC